MICILLGIYVGESITLVVFGIAKVERVRMQALLSGLKLEAEMKSVHASGSYKEKAKGLMIFTVCLESRRNGSL